MSLDGGAYWEKASILTGEKKRVKRKREETRNRIQLINQFRSRVTVLVSVPEKSLGTIDKPALPPLEDEEEELEEEEEEEDDESPRLHPFMPNTKPRLINTAKTKYNFMTFDIISVNIKSKIKNPW